MRQRGTGGTLYLSIEEKGASIGSPTPGTVMGQRGTGGTPTMGSRAEHVGPRNTADEQFARSTWDFTVLDIVRSG